MHLLGSVVAAPIAPSWWKRAVAGISGWGAWALATGTPMPELVEHDIGHTVSVEVVGEQEEQSGSARTGK
jgi:hypothetical protein